MVEAPVINPWEIIPFHFWTVVFFVLGSMVGSFLNVCIYRMPRGESIVHPRSHCPHCGYMIPWFLNIPLVTWVYLGGQCANCKAPISVRYFLVELLTGILFMAGWLVLGIHGSPESLLATAAICVLLAGFVAATFIDFEHFIIPDEITIGGMVVGFLLSAAIPFLHHVSSRPAALKESILGIVVGCGLVYAILRAGKMAFGREKVDLPAESKIVFTESALHLPDKVIPYEEIFYRKSDTIELHGLRVELPDRCYADLDVRLSPSKLTIGEDEFLPEDVSHMEIIAEKLVLPREAMGFGDVKFMGAIGAFLGWPAVVFSLMFSAIIGSVVGVTLIVIGRREWSSRLPYGPYIAMAATAWIFASPDFQASWRLNLSFMGHMFLGLPIPGAQGQ